MMILNRITKNLQKQYLYGVQNIKQKKKFWIDKLIKYYCYNTNKCLTYFKGDFEIIENKGENIINPFYLYCSNTKCRKKKY